MTRSGSASRQSATIPTSAAWKIGAPGSTLIASTVPRRAQADGVVELAARADAHVQARRDRPAGDADLTSAREPALVGDLARRAELRAEQRAQRLERVVFAGLHAAAHADHDRRFRQRVEVVIAGAGEHADPAAGLHVDPLERGERRPRGEASAVIMPARTVAIWIADVAPIAATS